MEITLREIDAAAFFGDEGAAVVQPPARVVQLAPGAGSHPHRWNAGMIESGGKLVESWADFSARRYQGVDTAEHDRRSLAQALVPGCRVSF
jgi:hypothetical protein